MNQVCDFGVSSRVQSCRPLYCIIISLGVFLFIISIHALFKISITLYELKFLNATVFKMFHIFFVSHFMPAANCEK